MYEDLIAPEIQTFEYYKNHIPLFLRNSYGYIEHFRIWFDILMGEGGVVPTFDHVLRMLDVFAPDYLDRLAEMDPSGQESDILDKIAALFDVNRYVHVDYVDSGTEYHEDLTLTNDELLMLIKGQIIKNYCQGDRATIDWYYNNIGVKVLSVTLDDPYDTPTCNLYLIEDPNDPYSANVKKLFLTVNYSTSENLQNGMLNIYQLGVKYTGDVISLSSNTLKWDSNDANEIWDVGAWWL